MKLDVKKIGILALVVSAFVVSFTYILAWTNPNQNPPGGAGVITADSSGNIGIGISSPVSKLHVNGPGVIGYSAGTIDDVNSHTLILRGRPDAQSLSSLGFQTNSANKFDLAFDGSTLAFWGYAGSWGEKMRINVGDGNIGIGMTPSQKLDVAGYVKGTGLCIGSDCRTSWPVGGGSISGTTNYIPKFTSASTLGNSQFYDTGGNIGIGATNPGYKLEVAGDVGAWAFSYTNRPCSGGAISDSYGGHCYTTWGDSATLFNWPDAEAMCRSWGGHLATIGSIGELGFISNSIIGGANAAVNYWLGGHDLGAEGNWQWITRETWTGGTVWGWHAGEPNDAGGTEECLAFSINFGFFDYTCGNGIRWVCESE